MRNILWTKSLISKFSNLINVQANYTTILIFIIWLIGKILINLIAHENQLQILNICEICWEYFMRQIQINRMMVVWWTKKQSDLRNRDWIERKFSRIVTPIISNIIWLNELILNKILAKSHLFYCSKFNYNLKKSTTTHQNRVSIFTWNLVEFQSNHPC